MNQPGLIVFQKQPNASWSIRSTLTVPAQADVTLSPNGQTLVTTGWADDTITTYGVDPATGIVASHGPMPSGAHPARAVADPTGRFFAVASATGIWMYTTKAAGTVAQVPGSPFVAGPGYVSASFDSKGLPDRHQRLGNDSLRRSDHRRAHQGGGAAATWAISRRCRDADEIAPQLFAPSVRLGTARNLFSAKVQ